MKGKFDKKIAVHICLFMILLCLVPVKVVFASALEMSNDASEMTTTAMETTAIPAVDFKETGSLLMMSLKVIGSLGLVIGLMLLLIFWFRKLGLTQGGEKNGSLIKILDTRMIAHKKYVSVLNIAGDFVVIGISEQQINMLTTLKNSGELLDYARANEKGGSASPTLSFSSILKKVGLPLKRPKQQD